MELRPGYKQSEVGPIPKDWHTASIKDVASISTGKRNTQDNVKDGAYPFFVRSQTVERIDTYSFDGEAVLTAGDGVGTGRIFHYVNGKFDVHQRVYRISHFVPELDGRYFYLYFAANFCNRVSTMTAKSSVDSVRMEMIADMAIPIPTVAEQRAIVATVGDADAVPSELDQLIAKKRDIKHATTQQLLTGRRRLPGFQGTWDSPSLGDLFEFKNGLNKGKEFFGTGTPIVNYMDVYEHSELNGHSLAGRVSVTRNEQTAFSVENGDVFFTRTSETVEEIGKAAIILNATPGTVFSGFLLRARPKDDSLCDGYKRYCFASHVVRKQITSHASHTTRALTNGRLLSAVVLQRPPPDEQAAIAAVLSDMDAEIAALERRRDKTLALKQGMVQDLLTGKTRLV